MIKKYRPSSGTEGISFMAAFCDRCKKEMWWRNGEPGCSILAATFLFDVDHPEYPLQWQRNEKNEVCCTAFDPMSKKEQEEFERESAEVKARDLMYEVIDRFGIEAPEVWAQAYYIVLLREAGLLVKAFREDAPLEELSLIKKTALDQIRGTLKGFN